MPFPDQNKEPPFFHSEHTAFFFSPTASLSYEIHKLYNNLLNLQSSQQKSCVVGFCVPVHACACVRGYSANICARAWQGTCMWNLEDNPRYDSWDNCPSPLRWGSLIGLEPYQLSSEPLGFTLSVYPVLGLPVQSTTQSILL